MTETTTATVTYRKTKQGVWVVCGPTAVVKPGEDVTVTLKSGATKVERVQSVGKAFMTADGELVYGYIAPKGAPKKPVDFRPMGAKECGKPVAPAAHVLGAHEINAGLTHAAITELTAVLNPTMDYMGEYGQNIRRGQMGHGLLSLFEIMAGYRVSAPAPAAPAPAPAPVPYLWTAPKAEVHYIDGTYYRVGESQKKYSGKTFRYLNKWVDYTTPGYGSPKGKWVRTAFKAISADTRATLEQIKEYGKAYKKCVFCSLKLELGASITAGYGETCAHNHGLPWGGKVVQVDGLAVPETALVNLGDGLVLANAAAPSKQYEESLW